MSDSTKQSLSSEIYTGTADFGKTWSVIGAITSTFIGIILFVVGIVILVNKSTYKSVMGIAVSDSVCSWSNNNGNSIASCTTEVKYSVGIDYQQNIDTGSSRYKAGDYVKVYYGNNPNSPTGNPVSSLVGWVLIIIAVLMIASSWIWVFLTRKYKFAAAAEGVSGAWGIIKSV